jgi:hypothetical protein
MASLYWKYDHDPIPGRARLSRLNNPSHDPIDQTAGEEHLEAEVLAHPIRREEVPVFAKPLTRVTVMPGTRSSCSRRSTDSSTSRRTIAVTLRHGLVSGSGGIDPATETSLIM